MSLFTITAVESAQGKVTVGTDGTLSYTAPAEFNGDTITCTIQGRIVINSVPADAPPIVGPDAATVVAGGTVTIDVLGNDLDPEGQALSVTGATADRGTVSVGSDGRLSYTAPTGYSGAATITYTASDPAGNASEGTVSIQITSDLPPAIGPDEATVMQGSAVTIDVLVNDVDPEGEPLSVTGATADRGTVSANPDGTLSYTAPTDYSGAATITYTASDPAGNTSQGTVSLTVTPYIPADLAPVVGADEATVVAGGTIAIDVLLNDVDPEGQTLSVTGATADRGTVSVRSDGKLSYTAPADYSGVAKIAYIVADPAGNASQGLVTIEVVAFSVVKGEVEGEFLIGAAPGELTITVTAPAEDAGEYVLKTADLAAGPVNLVPPRISGTAAVGATLTARSGLWAIEESGGSLAVTRQWLRGAAPIEGATGASYAVSVADAGQTLSVVETAAIASRGGDMTSAGVAIPAATEAPSGGWTPAKLPGLALWLDASDPATVTQSGSDVVELADKSGNGRHVRKVASLPAPTLEAMLGGKPALRFPQGSALRSSAASLPGLPGMPGVTVLAVTQAHHPTGFNKCFAVRNAQGSSGQQINLQTGYSMMWFGNGNRYWKTNASGPVVCVARYPENGTHEKTEWWRNGAELAPTSISRGSNSISLPADAYVQIGSEDSSTSEQAEVLLVVGPLSAADRQKAEGYLAHKWGLAEQLPAEHPHRSNPPA